MPMHFMKYFVAMKNMKPMNTTQKKVLVKKSPWNNGKIETKNRGLVIGNGQRPVDTCGM